MSSVPLITVVIPCYLHAQYLPEAVESVVAQSFERWEIIIVDDGSPDDTAAVAEALIARYPQRSIRLLRQSNQGLAASRNNAIRQARGDYILPLDADDAIAPGMLAASAAVLDSRPEIGFVYTDVQRFGAEHTLLRTAAYDLDALRFDCLMMPATLFRKAAWAQTSGFFTNMGIQGYEDWDFWLRLAAVGWQGHHLPLPLLRYRRSASSMLTRARRHDLELRAQIVLNHRRLYEPPLVTWAEQVCSPAWSRDGQLRGAGFWLAAYLWYCALVVRFRPQMLPKAALRPLFWRIPVHGQGSLRNVLRRLRLSG
jgi:glycosyltransferase involved in cell wall biosynthesis